MTTAPAYFDSRVDLMATNREAGTEALCYTRQVELLESLLRPGMFVLDVGCGPALPYAPPSGVEVFGLDPSRESLRANRAINDGLVGTAESIPHIPDGAFDLVVAFYSLHHVTIETLNSTHTIRRQAFREMARVLRPGGELLVFEMSPRPWAAWVQERFWNSARTILGDRLDACFYTVRDYAQLGELAGLGPPTVQTFDCSPFETFPPILSLPWLRIPRCLFPFDAALYRWKKET